MRLRLDGDWRSLEVYCVYWDRTGIPFVALVDFVLALFAVR
jgi:hypothetical protein